VYSFPMDIPESYDAKNPPPLLLFAPDRYFEVAKWMKGADLWKHAEKSGVAVAVVHSFTTEMNSKKLESAITTIKKKLCFDEDRVMAIGSGNGADAVAGAACDAGFVAIVTSGARPVTECVRGDYDHLHFENRKDDSMPSKGASTRPLSKTEKRIEDQKAAMSFGGIPLKRDILLPQDGDDKTPCTPSEGVMGVDEFITSACAPLGCADAKPKREDSCDVHEGATGSLTVCTVNAGRFWTPNYSPKRGCWGSPTKKFDVLGRIFSFLDASLKE